MVMENEIIHGNDGKDIDALKNYCTRGKITTVQKVT